MEYVKTDYQNISVNPAALFAREQAILSAGKAGDCNSMLIGWGSVGTLWGKPVVTVYVRPERYTMKYLLEYDTFSVAFYDAGNRQIAPFGARSGRDCDKYALTGLRPLFCDGTPYTDGAKLVLICCKRSVQDMEPSIFTDPALNDRWYGKEGYHNVIVGEITACLTPEAIE
ncbi:MAG: flavin reductase [Clostridia bacterium]|nr:flavin reductase [Clostridia bacterium]